MTGATQTYVVLLAAGLLLTALEIVVPGGILGVLGGLALLVAIIMGFVAFPGPWGLVSAVSIVVGAGVVIALWIRFLPATPMGRTLTLSRDGKNFKSYSDALQPLLGKEGVTQTPLRPAGVVLIDGQRVDASAEGGFVDKEARVKVIKAEGHHVIVRPIQNT